MKKLSPEQLVAVQELSNYRFIESSLVEFLTNGLSQIRITSIPGADWDQVEQAMANEFDEVFPNYEHAGKSINYTDPMDGMECELFYINYEDETLIKLIMKKATFAEAAEEKVLQEQSTTIAWTLEDIMRQEG